MDHLIAVFIGGLLAAGAGLVLDVRRERARVRQALRLFTTLMCDGPSHSISLYQRILDDLEKMKEVWLPSIQEFGASRQGFHNQRDSIVLIDREDLRKRIFSYYVNSERAVAALEAAQNQIYSVQQTLSQVAANIRAGNASLTIDEAHRLAVDQMGGGYNDPAWLTGIITDNLQKLPELKSEARALLQKLEVAV